MIAIAGGLLLPLALTRHTLSRTEGLLLVACYGAYLWHLWP